MRADHDLCKMALICIRRGFCSGQNQKAKVLKIATNSYRSLVLSSKAGAHKSLISDRKPGHKADGVSRTYEISLYCLTRPRMVLSVSVCRVSMVVYTHKISALKTLLLKNGEIYNEWVLLWSYSVFTQPLLYCHFNISIREGF